MSRNAAAARRFKDLYGEWFTTVTDCADHSKDRVEIVDLREAVPAFR